MSSKTIRIILLMMLVTIAALFVTQAYWFKKAFDLQERQFDDKINIALRKVANDLLLLDHDSSSRIPPITKISSNEYYVNTGTYFSLTSLDSSVRKEFALRKIDVDFDYVIVNAESNEIVLGNTIPNLTIPQEMACKTRLDGKDNLNFIVRINNKSSYLLQSMGIWMFSSFSLLLLLAVFTFIVVSMIKGKKLAQLKTDFVNNMTHELKTPIANISVASDAIRNRNVQMDEHKLEKYADIIYKENVRLHNLVDKVLQISAIEKNDESLSFIETDLHEVINEVASSFEPLLQERKGIINSFLRASQYKLKADRMHLSNVIANLIENAIKYSVVKPEITIRTTDYKDGILLEISDKGIGMSNENQNRIFEKFFRAETGNLHTTKGYGLGLSYVKLIVEKHRGLITFKSAENAGSTFNIFLPV